MTSFGLSSGSGGSSGSVGNAVNVRNFGALGDGTTDDTAAIQAAIDAAADAKRAVYIPNTGSTYIISSPLTYKAPMIGDGGTIGWSNNTESTTIQVSPSQTCNAINVPDATYGWQIKGIRIINADVGIKSGGDVAGSLYFRIQDCVTKYCNTGYDLHGFIGSIENCFALFCDNYGARLTVANGVTIYGGEWKDCNGTAAISLQGNEVCLQGCVIENNDNYGVLLEASESANNSYYLNECYLETNAKHIVGGDNSAGRISLVSIQNTTSTPGEPFLTLENCARLDLNNSGCRSGWPDIFLDNVEVVDSNCLPLWIQSSKPNVKVNTVDTQLSRRVSNLCPNPSGFNGTSGWSDVVLSSVAVSRSTDVYRDINRKSSYRLELSSTSGTARFELPDQAGLALLAPGKNFNSSCWVMIPSVVNFSAGDGGSTPVVGETVTGGTSDCTAEVISVTVSSGTFAETTAAGTVEMQRKRGTWSAGETITFSGGATATLDSVVTADISGSIGFGSYYRDDTSSRFASKILPNTTDAYRGWWQSSLGSQTVVDDGSTLDRLAMYCTLAGASGGVVYMSDVTLWLDEGQAGWQTAMDGICDQDAQDTIGAPISVRDFGAAGDGVTDDTAAIQAAIDFAAAGGNTVLLPHGIFLIDSNLTASGPVVKFSGPGTLKGGVRSATLIIGDAVTDLYINGVTFTTMAGIATESTSSNLASVLFCDNTVNDCEYGIHLTGSVKHGIFSRNRFNDLNRTSSASCQAIKVGNNDRTDALATNKIIVSDNVIDTIDNDYNAETHAILVYGTEVSITGNTISDVSNSVTTSGAESIYLKANIATCSGNTIRNQGGAANGAITFKGVPIGDESGVEGAHVTCCGNTILNTAGATSVIGISVNVDHSCVSGNTLINCRLHVADSDHHEITGNDIRFERTGAIQAFEFVNTNNLTFSNNRLLGIANTFDGNTINGCRIRNTGAAAMEKISILDNDIRIEFPDATTGGTSVAAINVWADTDDINDVAIENNRVEVYAPGITSQLKRNIVLFSGSNDVTASVAGNRCDFVAPTYSSLSGTLSLDTGVVLVSDFGAIGDGVTDDTAAIQSAIDSAAGTMCIIPSGTYLCDELTITDDDTTLTGGGTIKSNGTGVQLTISAERVNVSNITIDANSTARLGIELGDDSIDCKIEKVTITGVSGSSTPAGILFGDGCHNLLITGCTIDGVDDTGTGPSRGIRGAGFTSPTAPIRGVRIIGNHVANITPAADGDGIVIQDWTANCDVLISGNTFLDCAKRAIKAQAPGCVVTNNKGSLSAYEATSPRCAIELLGSDLVCTGNAFDLPDGATDGGIIVGSGVLSRIVVSGNRITATEGHGNANMDGMLSSSTGEGLVVSGNYFGDELRYGVRLANACKNCSITGNHYRGCTNYVWYFNGSCENIGSSGDSFSNTAGNSGNFAYNATDMQTYIAGRRVSWAASAPSLGTHHVGDVVFNTSPAAGTATDTGWVVTVSGTMGSLYSSVTADTTSSSPTAVVNDASDLEVGHWITIAGVTGVKIITAISGTTLTLHENCDATVDDGEVEFRNATFKGFGDVAA